MFTRLTYWINTLLDKILPKYFGFGYYLSINEIMLILIILIIIITFLITKKIYNK